MLTCRDYAALMLRCYLWALVMVFGWPVCAATWLGVRKWKK